MTISKEKSSVEPEQLALAGFRYSGQASGTDMVRCDYCSGRLQRWEETDEPLQEHARHYPDCPFLHPLTQQHKNPQVSYLSCFRIIFPFFHGYLILKIAKKMVIFVNFDEGTNNDETEHEQHPTIALKIV